MSKDGYFKVPNTVIRDHGRILGPAGIAVFCAYSMHAGAKGRTALKYATIGKELGISRRHVIRLANKLADLGLLSKVLNQGRRANLFAVNGHANLWTAAQAQDLTVVTATTAPGVTPMSPQVVPGVTPGVTPMSPLSLNKNPLTRPIINTMPVKDRNADGRSLEADDDDGALLDSEKRELYDEMVRRGLHRREAMRFARAADLATIQETLAHHLELSRRMPYRNPGGVLGDMFQNPAKWGLEPDGAGWKRPPPPRPTNVTETREECNARMLRERAEHERWRQQSIFGKGA
jgi:hypothetical protein